MNIYDLSKCPFSDRNGSYGGLAGRKDGILIGDERWIVKYPKKTTGMIDVPISYTTSPLNEFIGSHIYGFLGYPVHETILGVRNNKLVVACKDFCDDGVSLMEMRTIKNFANEQLSEQLDRKFFGTGDHVINLNEILLHLQYNDILNVIPKINERFWDMCVVDMYIKNGDRNSGNWGILRSDTQNGPNVLAPIFDNGGSFIDKAAEDKFIRDVHPDKILMVSTNFRTIYGIEKEPNKPESIKQFNAKDFINHALQYSEFRESLIKNISVILEKQNVIEAFIEKIPESVCNIPVCSLAHKRYFIETMRVRMEHLLIPAFEKAKELDLMKADAGSKDNIPKLEDEHIHNKSWGELEESDYARGCPDAIVKDYYSNSKDEGPELGDD
ncbi:MAG: hypothetical protein K0R00_3251 [Herbinix sp.]|jgi:hypothetical protein|nr:hypothetical protein [Herbinix sp.]